MITTKDQESLLLAIANKLTKKIEVFAIGGTAMMFLGFKDSTLDIDLVFSNENDRREFILAAKSLGYEWQDPCKVYGTRENRPIMLGRLNERFNLFLSNVISFVFSDKMKERATDTHQFGDNLIVRIANFHDIILMKCATDRIKDKDDIRTILENSETDWDIIISEIKNQFELGEHKAVFLLCGELSDMKKTMKMDIPDRVIKSTLSLLGYKE